MKYGWSSGARTTPALSHISDMQQLGQSPTRAANPISFKIHPLDFLLFG